MVYTLVLVIYTAVFIQMWRAMRSLGEDQLKKERKSIIAQFALFLLSFATRIIADTIFVIATDIEFVYWQ